MIDEKKLIEDLKAKIYPERFGERCNAMDVISGVLQVISEQPKTDWIPCEERLPENNTNVIACFSSGTVTELTYLGNGFFQGIYEYNTKVIVAWQPLPQPYKKEGAENG